MAALFGATSDDLRFPRRLAIISVAVGTFLVLVMLIFLGILGNQWKHSIENSSIDVRSGGGRFLPTLLFIRNHWTLLMATAVGIGTALCIVALRTRRARLVYGLGISSALAYVFATGFLVWLLAAAFASFCSVTVGSVS